MSQSIEQSNAGIHNGHDDITESINTLLNQES